ncbi:MAG: Holliday junction branch migration protein RuvA [Candidatus Limiplasma sp.]|nr:Holliday junction branch migration protein RuvA [Candidatus Limiplasma sp.]
MIAMISGTIAEKSEGEVVLQTQGGVGYRLLCSMNTLSGLPGLGAQCKLHTHLSVREDAMELYGFEKREERDMFRRLISVSGIGPRTALFVLGSMPLSDLRLAILTGDLNALSRAPGIGKKTAQRIALELKDRVTQDALASGVQIDDIAFADAEAPAQDTLGEAMQALKALGYTPQEAAAALKGIKGQGETADELIRLALRHMAKQA